MKIFCEGDAKVTYVKLNNICSHLTICFVQTNFLTSNLPSLKRAGAVLFREVLPAIVSFEKVIFNSRKTLRKISS